MKVVLDGMLAAATLNFQEYIATDDFYSNFQYWCAASTTRMLRTFESGMKSDLIAHDWINQQRVADQSVRSIGSNVASFGSRRRRCSLLGRGVAGGR
jgi:hypothetical protein